jgi:hypothetical protein
MVKKTSFGVSKAEIIRMKNKVEKDTGIKKYGKDKFAFKSNVSRINWFPKSIKYGS